MSFALGVLLFSLIACAYIYGGYPALLWAISRLRPRVVRRGKSRPSITLIIPAHNEEQVIGKKIANSLALDYPWDQLEILVVSDGSSDETEAIVRHAESAQLRLVCIPRSGKAHALNEGARQARGEILVFSDANALLEPDSIEHLVEPFADPEVGGVCGNKQYGSAAGADATEEGENLYWRFDKWQKELESRIGSIFAADGTLYAVRKRLYVPIQDPAQADDIAISARVVLQGYRLVYEPRSVAIEEPPRKGSEEFRRKVRVTNHSLRSLWYLGRALWTSGFYSVELLSHKFFRHLVPFFLIALLASNFVLARSRPLLGSLLALQLLFYVLALMGFALRGNRVGRWRLFAIPYYFSLVNAAAFLGTLSILRGERRERWVPRQGLEP